MQRWSLQSNSIRARIDHNKPPGFAELKPEGEGTTEVRKRAGQPYKHPMHGEETATTAFKLFPMSGSTC